MAEEEGGTIAEGTDDRGPQVALGDMLRYQAPTDERGKYQSSQHPRLATLLNSMAAVASACTLKFLRK